MVTKLRTDWRRRATSWVGARMTMMSSGPGRGSRPRAENDIYTVLMLVAFLFVLAAILYVGYRAFTLFGNVIPMPGG